MILKLSALLTKQLTKKNIIPEEEQELYEYAFFMIVSYSFFFLISLFIGTLVKISIEAALFFISFSLIRNHAGGIHASSEARCTIITIISIMISITILKIMICYTLGILSIVLMFVAIFCLCFIKPVDNSNKELDKLEKHHQHKKVMIISTSFTILFFILFVIKKQSIAFSLSVSMFLAAILLLAGKIQNFKKNCKNNSVVWRFFLAVLLFILHNIKKSFNIIMNNFLVFINKSVFISVLIMNKLILIKMGCDF